MRLELARLHNALGMTFIIVTHDQNEALSLADRIAVMEAGRIRQIASPENLYEKPAARFVADFIGRINLFDARVAAAQVGGICVEARAIGRIDLGGDGLRDGTPSGAVCLAVRPEKLKLWRNRPEYEAIRVAGRVHNIAYYGHSSHAVIVVADSLELTATLYHRRLQIGSRTLRIGDVVSVSWSGDDILVLAASKAPSPDLTLKVARAVRSEGIRSFGASGFLKN
ncbi:MAG: TOBE domain-containing protein [Hyphomicrobiales bacterium]